MVFDFAFVKYLKMRGFGKRRFTEDVVINMTNSDTPTIDTMVSRFPRIAQDILKELDNKSLIKCRKVSVPWQNFIDNQKFIWIRRLQKYSRSMEEFSEQWKLMIVNTPTERVKELSIVVGEFFGSKEKYSPKASESQWAPLHVTADQGHIELSKYIIQTTGDKNPTRKNGQHTALHMAAFVGHTEVCRHIVELIEDKNPANKNGVSPLSNAAFNGHLEIYQLIAKSVEDKNPSENSGLTSLHLASRRGHIEVCKYIMDNLLDKNPPTVQGSLPGLTPYHWAASNGQLEICKLFLETLADKNPGNFNGYTPLHYASLDGHFEVCKVILESIENKNPVANNGDTALHWAAEGGHLELLQLFLNHGVDRRSIYNGKTPIHVAASNGHFRSCLFLMGNLQDIVSFFKGIWDSNSTKSRVAKVLLKVLSWLCFGIFIIVMPCIIAISIPFEGRSGIDYIKDNFFK